MGTTVAWVQALDEDSGNYGTQGIRYTSLGGSISELLVLFEIIIHEVYKIHICVEVQ